MKKCLIFIFCFLFSFQLCLASEESLAQDSYSAILIEANSGKIIYEKNIDQKIYPASMTKMMGMLLVIEELENNRLNYEEKLTTSEEAKSLGGSQIFLEVGEVMTVYDLLKSVCIASANDAMAVLAERIAHSQNDFVVLMNKRAKELGCTNTNFVNVTGLHDDNHYSTVRDISIIAKALVSANDGEILKFTSKYEDYIREDGNKFWLVNTNKLVRFYEGADGLKTGYTSQAKYNLTFTALRSNVRLISVVSKVSDIKTRNSETVRLMDYGFNKLVAKKVYNKNDFIKKVFIENGKVKEHGLIIEKDAFCIFEKDQIEKPVNYKYNLFNLNAPLKKYDKVGELEISNGDYLNKYDLLIDSDVEIESFLDIVLKNMKNILF